MTTQRCKVVVHTTDGQAHTFTERGSVKEVRDNIDNELTTEGRVRYTSTTYGVVYSHAVVPVNATEA